MNIGNKSEEGTGKKRQTETQAYQSIGVDVCAPVSFNAFLMWPNHLELVVRTVDVPHLCSFSSVSPPSFTWRLRSVVQRSISSLHSIFTSIALFYFNFSCNFIYPFFIRFLHRIAITRLPSFLLSLYIYDFLFSGELLIWCIFYNSLNLVECRSPIERFPVIIFRSSCTKRPRKWNFNWKSDDEGWFKFAWKRNLMLKSGDDLALV